LSRVYQHSTNKTTFFKRGCNSEASINLIPTKKGLAMDLILFYCHFFIGEFKKAAKNVLKSKKIISFQALSSFRTQFFKKKKHKIAKASS